MSDGRDILEILQEVDGDNVSATHNYANYFHVRMDPVMFKFCLSL